MRISRVYPHYNKGPIIIWLTADQGNEETFPVKYILVFIIWLDVERLLWIRNPNSMEMMVFFSLSRLSLRGIMYKYYT